MTVQLVKASIRHRWCRIPLRLLAFLLLAMAIGSTLNRIAASLEQSARPAGFARGVVQGALMPMAMPNLLVGKDVTIYAEYNTGVSYKLGYTAGVNACGAVFFGGLYWRLSRLRRRMAQLQPRPTAL